LDRVGNGDLDWIANGDVGDWADVDTAGQVDPTVASNGKGLVVLPVLSVDLGVAIKRTGRLHLAALLYHGKLVRRASFG
jgi:hypothetical protein